MKSKKFLLAGIIAATFVTGGIIYAADHKDTPALTGQSTDITDMYVFKGSDPNNLVFVANTHGLLSPTESATAKFDANTLIEFNIDTNGDNVEDKVIQAVYDATTNKINIYGPVAPSETGLRSKAEGNITASVDVTAYSAAPVIGTSTSGIKVFAGVRDDPFFFDLTQYKAIIAGTAPGGFNNPGTDTFAGTNVLSVVVEIPKSLLGAGSATSVNVWLETKKKI